MMCAIQVQARLAIVSKPVDKNALGCILHVQNTVATHPQIDCLFQLDKNKTSSKVLPTFGVEIQLPLAFHLKIVTGNSEIQTSQYKLNAPVVVMLQN